MNMRSAVWMSVVLALAAGPAMAAKKGAAKGKSERKAAITIEGHVAATNNKKNMLTMKSSGGETLVIKLDRETKVIRGSKDSLDITNLKKGKKIRVRYDDKGETKLARWVLILPDQAGDKKPSRKGKKAQAEETEEEQPAE